MAFPMQVLLIVVFYVFFFTYLITYTPHEQLPDSRKELEDYEKQRTPELFGVSGVDGTDGQNVTLVGPHLTVRLLISARLIIFLNALFEFPVARALGVCVQSVF